MEPDILTIQTPKEHPFDYEQYKSRVLPQLINRNNEYSIYEKLIFKWHAIKDTAGALYRHRCKHMVVVCIVFHFRYCEPLPMSHVIHSETKGSMISSSFLTAGLNAVVLSVKW